MPLSGDFFSGINFTSLSIGWKFLVMGNIE